MVKVLKNIAHIVVHISLLITVSISVHATSNIATISDDDQELAKTFINTKWIQRFSYYNDQDDAITQLTKYLWHFKENIQTLENEIKAIPLGPINAITPEIFGTLMGHIYTESIFQNNNEQLIEQWYNSYIHKIEQLQHDLQHSVSQLEKVNIPIKQYDTQIRKLSVHINEAKRDLMRTKKAYKNAPKTERRHINNQIKKIEQTLQEEQDKVNEPRRALFALRREKLREKKQLTDKINHTTERIKAENEYITIPKKSHPACTTVKNGIEAIKHKAKPFIKKVIEAITSALQTADQEYVPRITESVLWAFIQSTCNAHGIETCMCHMCNTIKQSGNQITKYKHPAFAKASAGARRASCANLIKKTSLLEKKNICNHQFAKVLYYSHDLKNKHVAANVVTHALNNNLLENNQIKNLVYKLIGKLEKYDYCDDNGLISTQVVSSIVETKSYNKHAILMEYITERPIKTLTAMHKFDSTETEYLNLFKIMATQRHITRAQLLEQSYQALDKACLMGYKEMVTMLIRDFHVHAHAQDIQGETLLHKAASQGHTQLVAMLLDDYHLDINKQTNKEETPLHKAASYGHADTVAILITHDAIDINAQDGHAETALHKSAANGHLSALETLLAHPEIKTDVVNKKRETILHKAALSNNVDVLKCIINRNIVDLNFADKNGETALHRAARNKKRDLFYVLIHTQGVDTQKRNKIGQTAFEIATKHGNPSAVTSILTSKPKQNKKPDTKANYMRLVKTKHTMQNMYGKFL